MKEQTKHTPGPWLVSTHRSTESHIAITAYNDAANIANVFRLPVQNTGEVNARLIAEAPAMLEALEDLLPMAEALHEVPKTRANKIREILARVKGGAS